MARVDNYFWLFLAMIVLFIFYIQVSSTSALNSKEYSNDGASVYGIDGYGVKLSLQTKQPILTANSTIISYTLKILEPFPARGTSVNGSDYYVTWKTLGFYLTSGAVVDYDRSRLIDTLWLNWANSSNSTHVKEENSLFKQNYWVNISKSDEVYFGSVVLPNLTEGIHNATIWIRAEQDQVTTYIPFWIAFSQTIILNNPSPSPTVPEFPITATLIAVLVAVSLLLVVGKRKQSFDH